MSLRSPEIFISKITKLAFDGDNFPSGRLNAAEVNLPLGKRAAMEPDHDRKSRCNIPPARVSVSFPQRSLAMSCEEMLAAYIPEFNITL